VRKAVLIALLALALAASGAAAAGESPYRARPTRWCLHSHGAHHLTQAHSSGTLGSTFGQSYGGFRWSPGGLGALDIPRDWIGIEFAPSPARGRASEQRVRHILRADYGFDAAWIRRHVMRRANVVIYAFSTNRPLTAGQRTLILGCLRR
jgi:hypothetical protein